VPFPQLDRFAVRMKPLSERVNKFQIETRAIDPDSTPPPLNAGATESFQLLVERIQTARRNGRPVMCALGAHSIKNGLGLVLARFIEQGWFTHLATNGAGIIHDWEFSYLGSSSEDVEVYTAQGQFGNWEETGRFINLALIAGSYQGLGYGESIGSMIETEGLTIPAETDLVSAVKELIGGDPERAAAAADLLWAVRRFELPAGRLAIPHRWKRFSAQAAALRKGIPFTGHPMIGHDIIYNHPMNHCASLGRCAERDFLAYARNVSQIEGGVYLSIGSAIMSPMIFEKSLSMSQNLARQRGEAITQHSIFVADLAECPWDWSRGEPPETNPAYYLRYNKTFSRMGGTMRYIQADNRALLLNLLHGLGTPAAS
jgi:hypothetical protein